MTEPSNPQWPKLPKLKAVYPAETFNTVEIEVVSNPGNFASKLSSQWLGPDKLKKAKETEYQEDLAALLVAAAISYLTGEVQVPAQLKGNPSDSAVDRVVVTNGNTDPRVGVEGSLLQIVCTHGANLRDPVKLGDLIWERIEKKHGKGAGYTEGVQLVVLVTQDDWRFDALALANKLKAKSMFSGYWVILPLQVAGAARFALNYFPLDDESRGQGQAVVDITDDVLVRHLGLYVEDGKLDKLSEYLAYVQEDM